ncbi:MAG: hypothetical protein EBX52_14290 [Proteobacteria bacterium]|nr:hypothetical protein [Pseudomonadota bacterium]
MKSDTGFECALAKTKKEILASPPKLPERLKELNDPPALAAAAAKLLDVNQWGEKTAMANMGNLSIGKTDFKLYDANGRIANRPAQEGDFVKITLPVPPPMSGVSWVRISHVSVTHRKIPGLTLGTLKAPSLPVKGLSIEVNPTYDPRPVDDDGKPRKVTPRFTDHFFDSKTSNFFNVEQIGDRVVTSVHGRNENTNLDECADPGIQRRNVLIAIAGIGYNAKQEGLIGMQKMTWRNFTKNLSKSVCENPEKAAGYKI